MVVPPTRFNPDMLLTERRTFYDSFIQKTADIAAKFVSTNPKPSGAEAAGLLNAINQVDLNVGSGLLMMGQDSLFAPVLSTVRGNSSIPNFLEQNPLLQGLVENHKPYVHTEDTYLYRTPFENVSLMITSVNDPQIGKADVLKASLIGSKVIESGKLNLDMPPAAK